VFQLIAAILQMGNIEFKYALCLWWKISSLIAIFHFKDR
jgi:hypothetical protein